MQLGSFSFQETLQTKELDVDNLYLYLVEDFTAQIFQFYANSQVIIFQFFPSQVFTLRFDLTTLIQSRYHLDYYDLFYLNHFIVTNHLSCFHHFIIIALFSLKVFSFYLHRSTIGKLLIDQVFYFQIHLFCSYDRKSCLSPYSLNQNLIHYVIVDHYQLISLSRAYLEKVDLCYSDLQSKSNPLLLRIITICCLKVPLVYLLLFEDDYLL